MDAKNSYIGGLWYILLSLNKTDNLGLHDNLFIDEYKRVTNTGDFNDTTN